MDPTFISMHDLTEDAKVLYTSESIRDVLGYDPSDVLGQKLFDYFHPDEIPLARTVHGRGVQMDKAAVLSYCQIKHKDGHYVICECIFSVVYDVFVAATSIYQRSQKSRGRALTAPVIRRVFSSSPYDPRYNMLTHLSSKFRATPSDMREPRAALILNRFTRSLTVLYSSFALPNITGFSRHDIVGRSFYEFINEDCLQNAVEAFERAKENDSIAYLRFRWRDPIAARAAYEAANAGEDSEDDNDDDEEEEEEAETDDDVEDEEEEDAMDGAEGNAEDGAAAATRRNKGKRKRDDDDEEARGNEDAHDQEAEGETSQRKRRRNETDEEDDMDVELATFGSTEPRIQRRASRRGEGDIEVEAVVSCTSDGLVVVLRRARPLIPKPFHGTRSPFFASPWARDPLIPPRPPVPPAAAVAAREPPPEEKPPYSEFMESIRQVAVFAWSLHSLGGEAVSSRKRHSSLNGADDSEQWSALRGNSCPPLANNGNGSNGEGNDDGESSGGDAANSVKGGPGSK